MLSANVREDGVQMITYQQHPAPSRRRELWNRPREVSCAEVRDRSAADIPKCQLMGFFNFVWFDREWFRSE